MMREKNCSLTKPEEKIFIIFYETVLKKDFGTGMKESSC